MRIHKAVQGRKGDEASAGVSPSVATGMLILERSETMDHGSDFANSYSTARNKPGYFLSQMIGIRSFLLCIEYMNIEENAME